MKELSQKTLPCRSAEVSEKQVNDQSERTFTGNNGIKFIIRETFAEDKNKDLQDILVNHMLTDRSKPGNNR